MTKRCLIVGSAGSVGSALAERIEKDGYEVIGMDLSESLLIDDNSSIVINYTVDVGDIIPELWLEYDLIINCAGISAIMKTEDIDGVAFDRVFRTNAYSHINLWNNIKKKDGCVYLAILSDAAYRPMRCSMLYNASKAAADMIIRCLARENDKSSYTIFGIAPNRIADTNMSRKVDEDVIRVRGWSKKFAEKHQLECLPKGETQVAELVDFISSMLKSSMLPKLHGCIIPAGASGF